MILTRRSVPSGRAGLKSALGCLGKPLEAAEFALSSRLSDFFVLPASDGFSPSRQPEVQNII